MNRSLLLKISISIVLTIVLGSFVFHFLQTEDLLESLKSISYLWLFCSFILFLVYQALRAYRFEILVDINEQRFSLFSTQCMHAFLNNTLPAGLGEIAFIFLLKHFHEVDYHRGTASLIIARLIDLGLFSFLFLILILFSWKLLPIELIYIMISIVLLLALLVTILWFAIRWKERLIEFKRFQSVLLTIKKLLDEFHNISNIRLTKVIIFSAFMWLVMYFFFVCIIYSLGFNLSLTVVLFLYLLIFPINLLPIKGVANFGTHEAAWFIALVIAGVSESDAKAHDVLLKDVVGQI